MITDFRHFQRGKCFPAILVFFSTSAMAQSPGEQEALARNCVSISIDRCYHDGINRFIKNNFLPEISKILTENDKNILRSVNFNVTEDRDALGASADYTNGLASIRITSSVGYHLSLFANAAVLNILLGHDLNSYLQYQQKAVSVLQENTRRARLGQTILATPFYGDVVTRDREKMSEVMKNPTALGMNAYFSMVMTFWVLSHEVGHQILGHTKIIANTPGIHRKKMEAAADDFAARALVKMGYSAYPVIFLMGYFAAIEENGGGSPDNYPPSLCRLANVFKSAWSERGDASDVNPRDAVNRQWNEVMDNPAIKETLQAVLGEAQCRN